VHENIPTVVLQYYLRSTVVVCSTDIRRSEYFFGCLHYYHCHTGSATSATGIYVLIFVPLQPLMMIIIVL
jgi:hypothetical protein